MDVYVITDISGGVLGVYTTERKAKACYENAQRQYAVHDKQFIMLTKCKVNEETMEEDDEDMGV